MVSKLLLSLIGSGLLGLQRFPDTVILYPILSGEIIF